MAVSHAHAPDEQSRLLPTAQAEDPEDQSAEKDAKLSPASGRFWAVVLSYSSILFFFACNGTVITTTYGAIAASLHAESLAATWLNASYLIASSLTNPLIGRLATLFRPVNLFLACTAAFTLGSALTGLAPNTAVFLLGRVLTGCGAGGLFTSANVLLVETAPVKRRGLLVGVINAVVTCGSSLGGVIGGAFAASRYGWRPAFVAQVPIMVVAAVVIYLFSPNPAAKHSHLRLAQKLVKIDYLGILTLSASLVLLLLAAMAPTVAPTPVILGVFLLVAFIVVEARFASLPIIPVSILAHRPTLLGCLATMGTMSARWTVLFYAPIWSIAVLGYHPASAGASLIPTSFGFALGGLLVGAFSIKHGGGYYWQSIASIALFSCTYIVFYFTHLPASLGLYLVLLITNGFTTGAVLNYSLAHVLSSTDEKAIVAGLYSTFRGLSPSVGAGLAGGILQRTLERSLVTSIRKHDGRHHLSEQDWTLIRRLKGSPTLVWQLEGWQRRVGILAYEQAIKRVFLAAIAAALLALVLQVCTRSRKEEEEKGEEPPEQAQRLLDD